MMRNHPSYLLRSLLPLRYFGFVIVMALLFKGSYASSSSFVVRTKAGSSSSATETTKYYDIDAGILSRVTEQLDAIMNVPREAINIMERFHHFQGFRPTGLHAAGRDTVMTYMYALIQAFGGSLKLYVGTEEGEYFTYFGTEAVYREPGNSGYDPSNKNSTVRNLYYDICVNGDTGDRENCTMAEGASYVQCTDDCQLVPCSTVTVNSDSEHDTTTTSKMCRSYTVEQVKPNQTLGFVPLGYHCIDAFGMLSQEAGKVMQAENTEGLPPFFPTGTCQHWDGTPVTGLNNSGAYAYCNGEVCHGTFEGLMRTVDYDPRVRPWYIDARETQQESWGAPYPFHTHSDIIQKVGITYARPYYSTLMQAVESGGNEGVVTQTVFEGVMAVDYTLVDISLFLTDNYGDVDDRVVAVMEASAPHYLIGISTGTSPYKEVRASDETVPCLATDEEECVTVRVPATDLGTATQLDPVASRAVQVQALEGFPTGKVVTFYHSSDYFSQSVRYIQNGTDLEWIVVVVSPMVQSDSDTILPGETMFITLILVATAGTIACCVLLYLWFSNRNAMAVMYGDFNFTSAFLLGCILLNMSCFTSLGENTDLTCILRFWSQHLTFALAIAPLLVKVYRVYRLIGSAGMLCRTKITHKQAIIRTLPIITAQVVILLVFTFVDPPQATEDFDLDQSVPVHYLSCQRDTKAFLITQTTYQSILIAVGCLLSFKSRNLDSRFGEAKQLLFGMYNVALSGICFLILANVSDVTPAALQSFRTFCVFWGTVLTCMVFVIPRLLQAREDSTRESTFGQRSSVFISGLDLDQPSVDSCPMETARP